MFLWLKRITLIIDEKKVICLKKVEKNPIYNTVIILTGAGTHASNYTIFANQFKKTEVIIINTPGHGFGKSLTEGESLSDGNDLVNFQVNVIKRLMKDNHCSCKITLLGYSIGGMTLLNIINRKLLDKNIDLCVLISSARYTRHNKDVIKGLYDEETSTFNIKSLIEKNCIIKMPWYIKHFNPNWMSIFSITCNSDFLQCDSMNEISKNELLLENNKNIIALLGENDFFFSKEEVFKTIKRFKQRSFILLKQYGHLFILERPRKAGKLIFNAIQETKNTNIH